MSSTVVRSTSTDCFTLTGDFKDLPSSVPKAFIYTGNGLDDPKVFPKTPPGLLSGAIGKHASAHFIDAASQTFGAEGYK